MSVRRKVVVAGGSASGAVYCRRLIEVLAGPAGKDLEVSLVFSRSAPQVWREELGVEPGGFSFPVYRLDDWHAPFASGSAGFDAMVVVPCSMGQVGRIAAGTGEDLISRAADVMLKERRRLVLVARETPLSLVHLRNLTAVTEAGAVVLPAAPSFYGRPATIDALVDTVIARVLDQIGVPNALAKRWGDQE
jgi:4-hydroxy-3-polyprenylbenzoate decarboxylase